MADPAPRPAATTPSSTRYASACARFRQFFDELRGAFAERDDVLQQIALGLLAREHVLLAGPPGTAKSQIAGAVLGRILNEETGAPSLYARQITESTVHTDLIGPIDFRNLMDTGRTTHFTDEGILGSVHAFLDEVFDGRDMVLRAALNVLQEREVKQGGSITKGKIECAVMTTNRYVSDILEQSRETLLAFVDRVAFIGFVPRGFADPLHLGRVLRRNLGGTAPPRLDALLTIQDLDVLQAAVDDVFVAPEVCDALAGFLTNLDSELAAATRADPSFSRTRYFSTRTAVRCGALLRAAAVYDRIFKNPKRTAQVVGADFKTLRLHLILTGPSPEAAATLLDREVDPTERRQLMILRTEREVFDECVSHVSIVNPTQRPASMDASVSDTDGAARTSSTPSAPAAAASITGSRPGWRNVDDEPDVGLGARLDEATANGDITRVMAVLREVAPHAREGAPNAKNAREILERATHEAARIATRAAMTGVESKTSLYEFAASLVGLAKELEDGTMSMHRVASWVAGRAFGVIQDAAVFAASGDAKLLVDLDDGSDPRVAIDGHITLLEKLGDLRRELRSHSAAAGVDVDDAPFVKAVERTETLIGAWWAGAFARALGNVATSSDAAPKASSASSIDGVLAALQPELERLDGLDARLSALSPRSTTLKAKVAGPRVGDLVRASLSGATFVERRAFVEQLTELAALMERHKLGGAIGLGEWLEWTAEAMLGAEAEHAKKRVALPNDPAGFTDDAYYQTRAHELRTSLTCVLAEVAVAVVGSAPLATAQLLPKMLVALGEARRRAIIDADVARITRALAFIEAWFDALGPAPLRVVAKSRLFHVIWDDGALARFAIEASLVENALPEAAADIARLRTRIDDLGKRAEARAVELLGAKADAIWAEARR